MDGSGGNAVVPSSPVGKLLATCQGRASGTKIRRTAYEVTRPCTYAGCPHDRDPAECDATEREKVSTCPSSVSPHPVRRGAITHHLDSDVPETVVGDCADVSRSVLEQHYDRRTEHEKMEQRRGYLDEIRGYCLR